MQDNSFISHHIKYLRSHYQLSLAQLADILEKSRTTISQLESGKVKLSQDFLIDLANFFAVSLDWLTGRSEEPYSEPVIKHLEDELVALYHDVNLSKNQNLIYYKASIILYLSKDYFSYNDEYTLEQRADVIFALNFWKYAANLLDEEGYDSQQIPIQSAIYKASQINDNEEETIIEKIYLKINQLNDSEKLSRINKYIDFFSGKRSSKRAGSSFAKLCYQCLDILKTANAELSSKKSDRIYRSHVKNNPSTD